MQVFAFFFSSFKGRNRTDLVIKGCASFRLISPCLMTQLDQQCSI